MPTRYLPLALLCMTGALGAEPKRDRFGDPLPEGAIARLGSLRFRERGSVGVTGFSLDGKILATFAGGDSLTCWDTASGREVRRMPIGHCSQPRCLRFSTDGKTVILADWDSTFRIVDAATGAERLKLEPRKMDRLYNDVRALAVSRDGKTAAAIYYKDHLVVWDLVGGKRLHQFAFPNDLHRFSSQPIDLTPDGKHLVVPHEDGSLYLLDVKSGKEVLAFEMPSDRPRNSPPRVTISPDGRCLVYGGESNSHSYAPFHSVTLCDMRTGKRLREFSSKENIYAWVFTPDGRSLAVSDVKTIHIFDVSSGNETKTLRRLKGGGLVFSPDGRKLAGSFGTCVFLWDVVTGKLLHSPIGHDWFIREIHFSPDGKRLVSNTSGDMIVWDAATSKAIATYRSGRLQQWFSLTADGESVQYLDWIQKPSPPRRKDEREEKALEEEEKERPSGTETRTIYRWDLATDRKEQETVFSIPAACDWFVVSPDGRRMAVVINSSIQLRDVKGSKSATPAAKLNRGKLGLFTFSPDGRRLLFPTTDESLCVVDATTAKVHGELKSESPQHPISHMACAADGRSVALCDGRLCIREVASGKDRLRIPLPKQSHWTQHSLALSPDSRFLAFTTYGGNEGNVHVFSAATGKRLARWWGELGTSQAVAFSPDNRLLATGGFDGTLLLWKVPQSDGLPDHLSPEEAVTFWQALAGEDAMLANRALAGLAAAPSQAVPLIEDRFPSIWKTQDAKRLARLVAELDDDGFVVRERATRELSEAGLDAADALRTAWANNPSPEARRRLEKLLAPLKNSHEPKHLRAFRAIEVLERIGSPQSRQLLRELAGKPLPAEVREDIQASLSRIEQRRANASRRPPTP